MPDIQMPVAELIEAGVHFGHKSSKWNPKMAPYIFGKRNLIHIIDVRHTIKGVVKAYHFLSNVAKKGELVLFVGTKRQASSAIEREAKRAEVPYVSERWIGGSLTNYSTVLGRLNRLKEIETWEKDGVLQRYKKKEISMIMREKRKLLRNIGGIRLMEHLPKAILIVDPGKEKIAVEEAKRINAATIAMIDTDSSPDNIDIPIPCNEDSLRVVQIIVKIMADAVIEGRSKGISSDIVKAKTTQEVSA